MVNSLPARGEEIPLDNHHDGSDFTIFQSRHGRIVTWEKGAIRLHVDDIRSQPFICFRANLAGYLAVQVMMRDQITLPASEYVQFEIDDIRLIFRPASNPGSYRVPSALLRKMLSVAHNFQEGEDGDATGRSTSAPGG
jgi:hypothetical protein